jgi:hypothetical protein
VRDHHIVEGPLHIQHHGVEAATGPAVDRGHRAGRVVQLT